MPHPGHSARCPGCVHMRRAWLGVRSALLWTVSLLHFGIAVPTLVGLAVFLDPKKHDWLQRAFCRRIIFFAGAKLRVVRSPGFNSNRTCFFISNHVNLFDPSCSTAPFHSLSAAGNSNRTSRFLCTAG